MWSNPHAHILSEIYDSMSNEKLYSAKYTATLQCAIKDISSHQHELQAHVWYIWNNAKYDKAVPSLLALY